MYNELVKRLKETSKDFGELDNVSVMLLEAANAIEDLAAFKEQITDGHMYCMKDVILYRASVNLPKCKSIKIPLIEFAEHKEG